MDKREKKSKPASCMCWFPTSGSQGDRQRRQRQQSVCKTKTPEDTIVATLGYQGDGAMRGSVSRTLGAPLPVLPPARSRGWGSNAFESGESAGARTEAHEAQQQASPKSPGGHPQKNMAKPRPSRTYTIDVGERTKWQGSAVPGSSLSEFSIGQSSLDVLSPPGEKQEDLDDDIMDIPIEIPSPPSAITCKRVLVPPSLILRPSPKPSIREEGEKAKAAHGDHSVAARGQMMPKHSPTDSGPILDEKALPRVPPRSHWTFAQVSRETAARGITIAPQAAKCSLFGQTTPSRKTTSIDAWSNVKDHINENETDWPMILNDPTVVIAARRADAMPDQGAVRITSNDLHKAPIRPDFANFEEGVADQSFQRAAQRRGLEDSHGFFTSSSYPFSSSPAERPNEKTSGSIMSAASTNNDISYQSSQSTAQHQNGRDSPGPVLERWAADGVRIRDCGTAPALKNGSSGRAQSSGGRPPSLPGRPPSPCLRPGTLKNLTSAFENHIRRFQGPPADGTAHRIVSPRFTSNESLRRRIESDLKMLSLSDDDSSSESSPRDRGWDEKSTNNGLLC